MRSWSAVSGIGLSAGVVATGPVEPCYAYLDDVSVKTHVHIEGDDCDAQDNQRERKRDERYCTINAR
jgi:hypothetical protein